MDIKTYGHIDHLVWFHYRITENGNTPAIQFGI